MKKIILLVIIVTVSFDQRAFAQTDTFDQLNANSGSNKKIEWVSSGYGSGYGHKIYNLDPGFGGKTLLNFAGRNNNASWTDIMTITSNGKIGIGTTDPSANFHIQSPFTMLNSTSNQDSNMLIEGTSSTRRTTEGAALGFVVPANTDGSNGWEQGRLLVTPDNADNGRAEGRMYIQTRDRINNQWKWVNNLVLRSSGNVGIGTTSPEALLEVESSAIDLLSTNKADANMIIQGTSSSRNTSEGAALGFIVPANSDGTNHWQQGRIIVTPDNTNTGNASGRMYLQTRYYSGGAWSWRKNLVLGSSGSVGIGTEETGSHKLAVEGSIGAREIKVEASGWSDFVFSNNYVLRTLEEVEQHITENGHLPEIPSEAEVTENGINLGEMNAKLLQKIEELTLYLIEQNKELKKSQSEIFELKEKVSSLENE
ncbi:hypothetical protein [Reichenbachiella sp.]|uniref:hypothetical protein n=1 Tax=Reichenbachiella sp. TaxID=2184521 RepID=UPI003BB00706